LLFLQDALRENPAHRVLVALVSAATIVMTRREDWLRIAVRAAGSWIAAIGLMVAVV
jgi:hypothetical protein